MAEFGKEVRKTSKTGAQKGSKQAVLGDVAPEALLELAMAAGYGREKYDQYNYLKGMDHSLMVNAAFRHILAHQSGEDIDEESGRYHLALGAWQLLALLAHVIRGIGHDDRPTPEYMLSVIEQSEVAAKEDKTEVFKYSSDAVRAIVKECGYLDEPGQYLEGDGTIVLSYHNLEVFYCEMDFVYTICPDETYYMNRKEDMDNLRSFIQGKVAQWRDSHER